MTNFEQNLNNLPTEVSDPKILFMSTVSEHEELLTTLHSLALQNNRLIGALKDTFYMDATIYEWMTNQINLLDILSFIQPNLNNIPYNLPKSDLKKAIMGIGMVGSAQTDLTFLDISNPDDTNDDVDLKSFDLQMNQEFLQLLPPSMTDIIIDIAFGTSNGTTVPAPADLVMALVTHLIKIKKSSLAYELDIHYTNFIEPWLTYQYFLEENRVSYLVDRLHLVERFILEGKVFTLPVAELSYSNTLLWSSYFKAIFLYKNASEIRFYNTTLPSLTSEKYNALEVSHVQDFVENYLSDHNFARWSHELVTRCNRLINDTGDRTMPTSDQVFVGLDVNP